MRLANLLPLFLGAGAAVVPGCATIHAGEFAMPLDASGRWTGKPATALGLVISGRELTHMATASIGAVEVTIENTSSRWVEIGEVGLDFQNETANRLVSTPPDADARSWAQAVAQRDAVDLTNRTNALAGVAFAGRAISGSRDHGLAAFGALLAMGALIGLIATAANADVDSAEQVAFVPENHLLVAPFSIAPGYFVKRWIALTTDDPHIPCLHAFIFSYATRSGQRERVRLRFRDPDGASVWQRRLCGPH
jgi:hypothetical protein